MFSAKKRPLRTLFYGQTHEHAPGKLETLTKMTDDYAIVARGKEVERPPCGCSLHLVK